MTISTKFELRQKVQITSKESGWETGWIKAIFPDIRVLDIWYVDKVTKERLFQRAEHTTIRYWVTTEKDTNVVIEDNLVPCDPIQYWDEKEGKYQDTIPT